MGSVSSRLPWPRANLELAHAVAEEGDIDRFRRYLAYGADEAPYISALEFLLECPSYIEFHTAKINGGYYG